MPWVLSNKNMCSRVIVKSNLQGWQHMWWHLRWDKCLMTRIGKPLCTVLMRRRRRRRLIGKTKKPYHHQQQHLGWVWWEMLCLFSCVFWIFIYVFCTFTYQIPMLNWIYSLEFKSSIEFKLSFHLKNEFMTTEWYNPINHTSCEILYID